jgi:hypothetical protein
VIPVTVTPVFASAAQAADMARAGLRYLAAADPAQLTAAEQAECLRDLERITAVTTAARARVLGGFTAGKGYCDDGADVNPAVLDDLVRLCVQFAGHGLSCAGHTGPSLPLDVGVSRGIPAAIRTAVIERDQHCRFPGGRFVNGTLTAWARCRLLRRVCRHLI